MARPAQKQNTIKNSPVDGFKDQQIIQGILTSRIETRETKTEPFYYGFFKFPNQEQEIPVIWKKQAKPDIKKGSQAELKGQWAKSNDSRPSFTCSDFKIITGPPELTIQSLRKQIQPLLSFTLEQKQEWQQKTDFLFSKNRALEKLEKISKLGSQYLQAYLLTKNARYANYQQELLKHTNFTPESYLERMASELEDTERRIKVYQNKEGGN
ncbi:Single-stranded DNA-binding protein [endosymbiont GvMRE of Glomus versiforme]|nr:Single-stranded DNA-binding protein [endosymbiont GvMRE of Glomus versiforme]